MEESNSRIAVLEDVEEDTFIGFCEYAYTGAYNTPKLEIANIQDQTFSSSADAAADQDGPSTGNEDNVVTQPSDPYIADGPAIARLSAQRTPDHTPSSLRNRRKKKIGCWPEAEKAVEELSAYERLWEDFRGLSFVGRPASSSSKPDLLFHAKLYVFATKYLVDALRTQCLKSLHRDLCNFSVNKETAPQILDLLDFTYANTGRDEPGGRSLLRNLVIHYVACEARPLADDEMLLSLLDLNAEMGSDLVTKLVK